MIYYFFTFLKILQVFRSHARSDGLLADFCDGSIFKDHQLFQAHRDALQFLVYFDELEVCNPLGSHANMHKLGKTFLTILGVVKAEAMHAACKDFSFTHAPFSSN